MSYWKNRRSLAGTLATLLLVPLAQGCNQDRARARAEFEYAHGNFAGTEQTLKAAAKKTDENYVLNNARLGSVAMVDYDLDTAESAFLRAYEVINSTGVNDGGRAVSAAVVGENQKIWKGEPFERAMVNYYLGLIYYIAAGLQQLAGRLRERPVQAARLRRRRPRPRVRRVREQLRPRVPDARQVLPAPDRPDKADAMFAKAAKIRPDLAPLARGWPTTHPTSCWSPTGGPARAR